MCRAEHGGEIMAPSPPAASSPPAAFSRSPPFSNKGYATVPIVTVVATPEPDGPPAGRGQHDGAAALCDARHGREREVDEEFAGTGILQDGPKIVNRMMMLDDTSTVTPRCPRASYRGADEALDGIAAVRQGGGSCCRTRLRR